jgi:toxin-antitoxin system PIN domain toxin
MLAPDVNVLVYAHRSDEAVHEPYREWLEALVNQPVPFGLSWLVLGGFVRIVTNRRIYSEPTPLPAALAIIESLLDRPNCRPLAPTAEHWAHFSALCRATKAAGKLVADAQHAAVAIEHGCTWVSRDGDFARFAPHGLLWKHLVLG